MKNDNPLGVGATGRYPEGKLHENDEGEAKFAIAGDSEKRLVYVEFGKPVASLAMGPETAEEFARSLIRKAALARGETGRDEGMTGDGAPKEFTRE